MSYKFQVGDQFLYKAGNYTMIIKAFAHQDSIRRMNIYQVETHKFNESYFVLHSEEFLELECILLTKETKLELL